MNNRKLLLCTILLFIINYNSFGQYYSTELYDSILSYNQIKDENSPKICIRFYDEFFRPTSKYVFCPEFDIDSIRFSKELNNPNVKYAELFYWNRIVLTNKITQEICRKKFNVKSEKNETNETGIILLNGNIILLDNKGILKYDLNFRNGFLTGICKLYQDNIPSIIHDYDQLYFEQENSYKFYYSNTTQNKGSCLYNEHGYYREGNKGWWLYYESQFENDIKKDIAKHAEIYIYTDIKYNYLVLLPPITLIKLAFALSNNTQYGYFGEEMYPYIIIDDQFVLKINRKNMLKLNHTSEEISIRVGNHLINYTDNLVLSIKLSEENYFKISYDKEIKTFTIINQPKEIAIKEISALKPKLIEYCKN